ncbi:hypothetical protein ACHAWU_006359 [Discostella pseudostelligera]|uniref:3'-5' exonuclease domain-containing protein n=1 Tax=Discostella pseudostelligera TaxID=259834 RepID=A0ABD3N400_9STRA
MQSSKTTRKRNQTPQQKELQVKRSRETKLNKKKQKEAAEAARKAAEEAQKKQDARNNFFAPYSKQRNAALPKEGCNTTESSGTASEFRHSTVEHSLASEAVSLADSNRADIIQNLDYDDDDEKADDESGDSTVQPLGVQREYVKAIQQRLQYEIKDSDKLVENWLLNLLDGNDWWIRKCHVPKVLKKLKLNAHPLAYYRDIYVWLPDVRCWKTTGGTCMPCCPSCKSNERVGPHAFRDNHFGRVVVDLTETYYVLGRRYICLKCKNKSHQLKAVLQETAAANNIQIDEVRENEVQYTFMGWNDKSLPLFPCGIGNKFPAILTWKAGLDKKVVDMMRPLFDGGCRPDRLSALLLEMHSRRFFQLCIEHEYELACTRTLTQQSYEPLGDFGDKKKYNGLVPTGKFLAHVYKVYHASIGHYLDLEVKKRGATTLHWDVSYKEAKHLCLYRGRPVFKGLVTAMNEVGEVRIQFHIYSDSHEQMKSALEAFMGTTSSLGLPSVRLFYTDNPGGDRQFYMRQLPSLQSQQDILDELCVSNDVPAGIKDSHPSYEYDRINVRTALTKSDVEKVVMALKEDIKGGRIGLDAEWNQLVSCRGIQTGTSKIQTMQIAYRNSDDEINVLVLKVGKFDKLPQSLISLLDGTDGIDIFGVNVSADLVKISRDFQAADMMKMDHKLRPDVHNLGMLARRRDVVQDAGSSLELIAMRVLDITLDKTLRCSDWSGKLTDDQIKYAAIDAAVSLEAGEKLLEMPDLSIRLTPEAAIAGAKVDLIPRHGSVACMATRAATATIINSVTCTCPPGMVYGRKKQTEVRAGKGCCVVLLNTVFSPALIIPNYKSDDGTPVTIAAFPANHPFILPICMMKEHVDSPHVRATPIANTENTLGRSKPASCCVTQPDVNHNANKCVKDVHGCDGDKDDEEVCGYLDFVADMEGGDVEDANGDFTNDNIDFTDDDIDRLCSALFDSDNAQPGGKFLECKQLSSPPDPKYMVDRFSSVLGDCFHAMDRTKVPIRHEARKGYFVALREAFFVWNPVKLKELEERMKNSGLSDEAIQRQRYFNMQLFRDCVDRSVPPPKMLYWRVRAVYATYGPLIDSKTKAPLFNARAWSKADNLLKEILEGYYSDPPGIELYCVRLREDGTLMRNKYGMEIIECSRGTNRTEAYHKNIMVAFGSWAQGVEMSDCLLRERRHRHNQNVSEKRRFGFPRIGHYDTWLVDLLQILVMKNHNLRIYPDLSNTSEYVSTDESFDSIALHSCRLDKAVRDRYAEIDKNSIKLTRDQQYLCRVMGTPMPFLPFSGEQEYKAYAKFVIGDIIPTDDEDAAIGFCPFVDGTGVFPKLPTHMRTHKDQWERNQRVKESVRRVKRKNDTLLALNERIVPRCEGEETNTPIEDNGDGLIIKLQQCLPVLHVPPRKQILPGEMIPLPQPQAIIHTSRPMIVGGVSIENSLGDESGCSDLPVLKKRGRPPGSRSINGNRTRSCGRWESRLSRHWKSGTKWMPVFK